MVKTTHMAGGPWETQSAPKTEKVFSQQDPKPWDRNPKKFAFGVLSLLLCVWLASGFYQVDPAEKGIVLRFGKWQETTDAGWHYHMPYPIETVIKPRVTATNQIKVGFGSLDESLMITGDRNIVDISFLVQWRISDPLEYLFNMRQPEGTVKAAAESAMRDIVSQIPIDVTLAEGRSDIEQRVMRLIQSILDEYKAGIQIMQVSLKKVDPPKEVIEAFYEVERAQADQGRLVNTAEAYRNDIVPKARGEAASIIAEAQAYREAIEAQAEGDAARFMSLLSEYKKFPRVIRKRLYFDTMEHIFANAKKVVQKGTLSHIPLTPKGHTV